MMLKILALNFICFLVWVTVYFITGFWLGFGSGGEHQKASWLLYIGFAIVHVVVNIALLYKKGAYSNILPTTIALVFLYAVLAWYYK